ncbi:MAG TPA: hypothetical protein VLF39_04250 [Candidatus Saccharimonadales bacterium]|nr:hypothetical protein [Candidatus Saccharimonadales bacterium]
MNALIYLVAVYINRPKSLPSATPSSATIHNVVTAILATLGAIAVFIIALGGFKYVMSRGDPQATARAKDTILYAIVGLVVAIMAYSIVAFVIPKVTS